MDLTQVTIAMGQANVMMQAVERMSQRVAAINTATLDHKIQMLKRTRLDDPIQRMQSEAIVELYTLIKEIQNAMPPIPGAAGNKTMAGVVRRPY